VLEKYVAIVLLDLKSSTEPASVMPSSRFNFMFKKKILLV